MQQTYQAPRPPKQVSPMYARTIARTSAYLPRNLTTWILVSGAFAFFLISMTVVAIIIGTLVIYGSGRILPGVSSMGVSLGGMTVEDAAAQLQDHWSQIKVRHDQHIWMVSPSQLGLAFDANATAQSAQYHGRGDGEWLAAFLGSDSVTPVIGIDQNAAMQGFKALASTVEIPAQNATVRLIDGGNAVAIPAIDGLKLDVDATVNQLMAAQGSALSTGALDLVMTTIKPNVTDASALVERAKALLGSPLTINAFDPITNQMTAWTLSPDQWGQWLTTENTPSGVAFSVETNALTNFLNGQNLSLGNNRHLDIAKSVETVRKSVIAGQTTASVQVYHSPTKYTIRPGDTIGTIAWQQGVMMWRITKANPGIDIDTLNAGQVINIPSKDDLLPLPVVANKRIIVSISEQRMRVYENGQVKWDWRASTGIPDSPTAPGIFQVQSHDTNAYAGNWNLWMPYFMGIYEAVPGFMNGIHGFPTRNGQGILWERNLGTKVTYGCILISTDNSKQLFGWAEDGVVIEIQT